MFTCTDCKKEFAEVQRSPWPTLDRCAPCMLRCLAMQRAMESTEAVETDYGWATAHCWDGIPGQWACLHLHSTKQGAEECIAGPPSGEEDE